VCARRVIACTTAPTNRAIHQHHSAPPPPGRQKSGGVAQASATAAAATAAFIDSVDVATWSTERPVSIWNNTPRLQPVATAD